MTLQFFVRMCNPEKTNLLICTLGKDYTNKRCDFTFTYDRKCYNDPFWRGSYPTYRVNGKAYKNAEIVYIEPYSSNEIKVVVK